MALHFSDFCEEHGAVVTVHAKLDELNADCSPNHVVIHDETDRRYTRFYGFAEFKEMYAAYIDFMRENGTHPHLHETLRFHCVQRVRFDIDCADVDYVTHGEINDLIDDIIAACMRVYELDYTSEYAIEEGDFFICTSSDSTKHSYHVLTPIYGATADACNVFFRAVMKNMKRDEVPLIEYIDENVHKRIQNFRLPYSTKVTADERVKVPESADDVTCWSQLLVGFYDPAPRIHLADTDVAATNTLTRRSLASPMEFSAVHKMLLDVYSDYQDHWDFRCEKDGMFFFNRIAPSSCVLCERHHDHDNTMYVSISSGGIVYMRCRKAGDKKMKIGKMADTIDRVKQDIVIGALAADTPAPFTIGDPDKYEAMKTMEFADKALRPFPTTCRTLYVRAQMKMGKTTELINMITATRPKTVVFVSFRVTFTSSILERLLDSGFNFERYSDIKDRISLDAHPYLIVQVDSLQRVILNRATQIDLLVLDESESVLSQFTSSHISKIGDVYAPFQLMVRRAARVVAMDANLGERTLNIIDPIRTVGRPIQLGVDQSVFYHATHRNAVDDEYFVTTSNRELLGEIHNQLRLKKRVVVATNSLEEAKAIYQSVQRTMIVTDLTKDRDANYSNPEAIRVGFYSAHTSPTLRDLHFKDVKKYWSQYDLLIYTPTVTAGISFEERHFDVAFGSFTAYSCDVETCRQMLGRVRDIGDHKYYICLNGTVAAYPTERGTIENLLDDIDFATSNLGLDSGHRPVEQRVVKNEIVQTRADYFQLIVENTRHQNMSRNMFSSRFINQVRATGATVTMYTPPDGAEQGELSFFVKSQLVHEYDTEVGQRIERAVPLSPEQYEDVKRAKQGKIEDNAIVTDEDLAAYTKRQLMEVYEVAADTVTARFYVELGHERTLHTYLNIREYKGAIKWLAAFVSCNVDDRFKELRMTYRKREGSISRSNRMLRMHFAVYAIGALGITYLGERHDDKMPTDELEGAVDAFIARCKEITGPTRTSVSNIISREFGCPVRDRKAALTTALKYFGISLAKSRDVYTIKYDVNLYNVYAMRDAYTCRGSIAQ